MQDEIKTAGIVALVGAAVGAGLALGAGLKLFSTVAIVGLATGIFTIWDRWVRGRPPAWCPRSSEHPGHSEVAVCSSSLCKVLPSLGEFAPVRE